MYIGPARAHERRHGGDLRPRLADENVGAVHVLVLPAAARKVPAVLRGEPPPGRDHQDTPQVAGRHHPLRPHPRLRLLQLHGLRRLPLRAPAEGVIHTYIYIYI